MKEREKGMKLVELSGLINKGKATIMDRPVNELVETFTLSDVIPFKYEWKNGGK